MKKKMFNFLSTLFGNKDFIPQEIPILADSLVSWSPIIIIIINSLFWLFHGANDSSKPSKHATSFWRPCNVHNVKTTSYGRQKTSCAYWVLLLYNPGIFHWYPQQRVYNFFPIKTTTAINHLHFWLLWEWIHARSRSKGSNITNYLPVY